MLNSYLWFAGTEIANHSRLLKYMTGDPLSGFAGLRQSNTSITPGCGCDSAQCLYLDQGAGTNGAYTSPILDDAPWYDPDVPESAEFAGFFIEDIEGFDSVVSRDTADGAISGTSLGPLRLRGRCITVTGWLRAKTCCAAEYGLRWLQESLLGDNSCSDCALGDLYMLKCCPPESDVCSCQLVEERPLTNGITVGVRVTNLGGGLYQVYIEDGNQVGVLSNPLGLPNNLDGLLPANWALGQTPLFYVTDILGGAAQSEFKIPPGAVANAAYLALGPGQIATIDIDLNVTVECEEEQQWITELKADLDNFIAINGDTVLTFMSVAGLGYGYAAVPGISPLDYARLFHRVGLTDGPKVTDRMSTCCSSCGCTNLKVQFTLCSELPYIFSDVEWCAQCENFAPEEYCLDLRGICPQCQGQQATKAYERQIPRPSCGIQVRHDGTWCPTGWDPEEACPPVDCTLYVAEAVEFTPEATTTTSPCAAASATNDSCLVSLLGDGSWAENGWNVVDGFPPPFCNLSVDGSGECDTAAMPPEEPCLIRLTYNECTNTRTWEPLRWDGTVPFPADCPCVEIAETCFIQCDTVVPGADDCVVPRDCPITVDCDGSWAPVDWVLDPTAIFPPPGCTFSIPGQDTTPLTEVVEIPADEFVPDCGPLPVAPPPPFLVPIQCYCDPWVSRKICCTLSNPGDWNDATTYIEVNTGSTEMRRLKIEAYQNPFGDRVPCPCDPQDDFWACRVPCSTLLVPQLPSGARLVIDSRTRQAQLILPGGRSVSAMRYIFSSDGSPFGWFDLAQCSTFCIVVSVDAQFVADNATVSIGAISRYLASGW